MNLLSTACIPLLSLALSGTASADQPSRPVFLRAERAGDAVRLMVIGQSDRALSVRYRLEAESGPPTGSNRSNQSGVAHLLPDERRVLIRLTMGSSPSKDWRARLFVTIDGGESYTTELAAGESR